MTLIPMSEKTPALFPYEAREHGIEVKRRWGGGKHWERFNSHLEIDELVSEIGRHRNVGKQLYHLELDPEKILFRQDLVKYVSKQLTLQQKLAAVHPVETEDQNCDGMRRKPRSIIAKYVTNLRAIIEGVEGVSRTHPFFQEVSELFQNEYDSIKSIRKTINRNYELRAAYNFELKVERKASSTTKKNELIYKGKNLNSLEVQVMESEQQTSETIRPRREKLDSDIKIGSATISTYELTTATAKIVSEICTQKRIKVKEADTLTGRLSLTAEQTGIGRFTSCVTYQIQHKDEAIEGTYQKQGGGGLPFVAALNSIENNRADAALEPVIRKVELYNKLLADLNTVGALSEASNKLTKKGARWPRIGPIKTHIRASKLQNPLTKIQGTRTTPNRALSTWDKPFTAATGANYNGKTFQGISEVQNFVLAQAALPTFGMEEFYPRSQILAHFPDYEGEVGGPSLFGGSCRNIRKLLENLKPQGYLLIDEPGTGTGFGDAEEIFWEVASEIAQNRNVRTYFSSHFLPLIEKLAQKFPTVDPIRFELAANGRTTYKHQPGVAKTSEGFRIAIKEKLVGKGLKKLCSAWERNGIVRKT